MCPLALPTPNEIDTIIFDLDDTLIDARGSWRAGFAEAIAELHARNTALQQLGSPEAIYDRYFRLYSETAHQSAGGGEWESRFTREAFELLLATHLEPDATLAARLHKTYRSAIPNHMALHSGAVEILELLGARYPLGLISNGPRELQRPKLEMFALEQYFKVIMISGEIGVQKPDPTIFSLALDALNAVPQHTIYVGDNPTNDIIGACYSGLAAIWINRGDWPDNITNSESPDTLRYVEVNELAEVPSALGL